jgi:hypothetical protein
MGIVSLPSLGMECDQKISDEVRWMNIVQILQANTQINSDLLSRILLDLILKKDRAYQRDIDDKIFKEIVLSPQTIDCNMVFRCFWGAFQKCNLPRVKSILDSRRKLTPSQLTFVFFLPSENEESLQIHLAILQMILNSGRLALVDLKELLKNNPTPKEKKDLIREYISKQKPATTNCLVS